MALVVETSVLDGMTYYSTETKSVSYFFYKTPMQGWSLRSNRKSLGRNNVGTHKYFDTLEDLCSSLKSFKGLFELISMK